MHKLTIGRMLAIKLLNSFERFWLRPGSLGSNSFILPPYRIVNPESLFIGNNTRIGKYAFIVLCSEYQGKKYYPKMVIGNGVSIGHNFFVGCQKNIIIEDNVLISTRVFMADTMHGYSDIDQPIIEQHLAPGRETIIEKNSFIGVNACILPGVKVGMHSVVAAGAVVTKDVSPHTVVAGNPARQIKRYSPEEGDWIRVKKP